MTINETLNEMILALNEFEPLVLYASAALTAVFIFSWYRRILFAWPFSRGEFTKFVLGLLPVVAFSVIYTTLRTVASHDVINDPYYIAMYLFLGFAWLYIGVVIMSAFFGLSWVDDVLHLNNSAALFAFTGGFLGLTAMYAASNIGDGPGWACVLFTGALGLTSWTLLTLLVDYFTQVFEKITVERDLACGIRIGCFLLAMSMIMAKKMAGDWLSVHMTLVDFVAAGPALAAIIGEMIFDNRSKPGKVLPKQTVITGGKTDILASAIWGITLLLTSAIGTIKIYG